MTSRELADRINDLCVVNVEIHSRQDRDTFEVPTAYMEKRELIIRDIADGLLRLDHNDGVAVTEPKPTSVRH